MANGEGDNGGNSTRRAIKMLRGGASEQDRDDFLREAQVMFDLVVGQALSSLDISVYLLLLRLLLLLLQLLRVLLLLLFLLLLFLLFLSLCRFGLTRNFV